MQEFRPMSVSGILDTTFRLYREHFVTFLLIALVVYVPYSLLATFVLPVQTVATSSAPGAVPQPGNRMPSARTSPVAYSSAPASVPQFNPVGTLLGFSGVFLFMVIFLPLCSAALTYNISAAYLGKNLSAGESYQRALPRLAALLGTQILAGLTVMLGLSC